MTHAMRTEWLIIFPNDFFNSYLSFEIATVEVGKMVIHLIYNCFRFNSLLKLSGTFGYKEVDMGYSMYVCPECRKVFKVQGNDKKVKCSNCSNILVDMHIAMEDWETMDKGQREKYKNSSIAGEASEPTMFEKLTSEDSTTHQEPEVRECPKCGFMNPAKSKICNECGCDMNAQKITEEKPKPTQRNTQSSEGGFDSFFADFNNDKPASNTSERKSLFDTEGTSTGSFMSMMPETKESPVITSNYSNDISDEKTGHSKLSIIALILGILGCTSIIGLIIAIVDLAKSKDDDYKHVCSWVCVGIASFWFIVGVALGVSKGSDKKEIAGTKPISELSVQNNEDTSGDSDISSEETENESETEPVAGVVGSDITIEEQVFVDEDGLKITATKYVTDSFWGEGVNFLIENDTSSDIGVGCDALIVNDYMITDLFSATVAAGKKTNEVMHLSNSQLRAAGIDNVGQIEVYMHTFDADTYSTIKKFPCFTIKTSAYDNMDITVNDEGKELYNGNGIRIVGKYVDENSFWGAAVLLYIENNSGKNVIIQCDDLSINGFMITPFFSCDVYDGKRALDDITLMSSELEENGITSIDDIELKFHIVDENFTKITDTDAISFSAK